MERKVVVSTRAQQAWSRTDAWNEAATAHVTLRAGRVGRRETSRPARGVGEEAFDIAWRS